MSSGIVAGHLKPKLADEVCEKTKHIINKKVNLMLRTLPFKVGSSNNTKNNQFI